MNHLDPTGMPAPSADILRRKRFMRPILSWYRRFARMMVACVLGLCAAMPITLPLASLMALQSACVTLDESTPDRLPEPTVRRVERPSYTAEQQKRADEVDQFLFDSYQAEGWAIVKTTQTYLGDITTG
jgi:hypothetical protein